MEDPFAALLLALDPLPVGADTLGGSRLHRAEDVRMPAHELVVHQAGDSFEIPMAFLLEQQREEEDLEEQVAELVEELLVVARERGVGDLVRLLDRVRHDRPRGLLAVPRAVSPKPLGQAL